MARRRARGKTGKAITPGAVARSGGTARDVSTDVANATAAGVGSAPPMSALLPRPPGWGWRMFGPGMPIDPVPINSLRPGSERPEPRLYEFPVSWNVSTSQSRVIPWSILRNAADGVSLFRRCIEVRKDHMRGLKWDIVISDDALEVAQRAAERAERKSPVGGPDSPPRASVQSGQPQSPPVSDSGDAPGKPTGGGKAAVEDELRDKLGSAIEAAKRFLKVPDRGNGLSFERWMGQALEEVFVLDALAIYPRYTLGGDLWSLEIVDGSTIKPLLDDRGGRPLPPAPAYQQILYGFPRGEFVATVSESDDGGGETFDGTVYPSDELIYVRRVDRVWSPYGLSAVEQALDDGALYLKRHRWMISEYTEGTSVSGLFTTDEATNWSPEQLLEYEIALNSTYEGSSAARHSARLLPPGVVPVDASGVTGSDAIAEKYKPDYDLLLIKLLAMHFDTTLPELGFTDAAAGGLGASGYHEGQENVQMRKRLPIISFLESLLSGIMHDHFGMPDELEFRFLGLEDEDEPGAEDVDGKRQGMGVLTLNERRDQLGRPRYTFPEADMPLLVTQKGIEVFEGASQVQGIQPPGVAPVAPGAPVPPPGSGVPGASSPPTPPAAPRTQGQPTAAKLAEAEAYRRWVRKGAARGRREFRWEHHEPHEVTELLKAGGADPKARSPWPGWSRDLAVASHYEPALTRALIGAVGVATLSARWTDHGGTTDIGVARAWLGHELAGRISAALTPVLQRVWTEGYLVGDVSAAFMLRQLGPRPQALDKSLTSKDVAGNFNHTTDWGSWTPGDARAAAAILHGAGRYPGLAGLLARGDVTISSIAEHRVDELARVLARAAEEGWSNGRTAKELRDLLTDPRWAKMVAITEVSRASSASSLGRYRDNGVDAKSWMTASDQRVCPECSEDEQQGDIPIGDYFQDGSDAPPGHPICRCAIAPGWLPEDARGAAGGGAETDLGGLGFEGLDEGDAALELADEEGEALELAELVDEWTTEVEEILAELEESVADEGTPLGGSTGADVRRVQTDSGRTLVRKTPKDPYVGADETEDAAHQRDSEVLGSQVARAVGLDAPAVGQVDETLFMTFMDGTIAEDLPSQAIEAFLAGPQGDLMRLVDLLISNSDRNLGNFMINGDRAGVFDFGLGFQPWSAPDVVPDWRGDLLHSFATRGGGWTANPLTARDVATLRGRLTRLEPAFRARGRMTWYDNMIKRLDAIGRHASGSEDLL
jgi:SPP1 gp7 family putative phage head morphogenesis protein